jgi:hypothetical protein
MYDWMKGPLIAELKKISDIPEFTPRDIILSEFKKVKRADEYSEYFVSSGGSLERVAFYIKRYGILKFGRMPALHITECRHYLQRNSKMIASTSPVVDVRDYFLGKIYRSVKLNICHECLEIIRNRTTIKLTGKTWYDFLIDIEESVSSPDRLADSNGYPSNWQQVAWAYKHTKKLRCERCDFQLLPGEDTKFIQVHHKNSYNKFDTRRSNLQALCVECHSKVDEYHSRRFNLHSFVLLQEFADLKKTRLT